MPATLTSAASEFLDAILASDLPRARRLLAPAIDFRAMTPSRFWEAEDPAGVEDVLRAWFEHPDRDVERIEPTEPDTVADTVRVGWRVYGGDAGGPFVYEQQAFLREREGRLVWLRIMCSGPRAADTRPQAASS